jgi:hypothetical protein
MNRGGHYLASLILASQLVMLAIGGCAPAPPAPTAVQFVPTVTVPQPAPQPEPPKAFEPAQPPPTETISWERLDIGMEPDSVYQPWMLTTSIKVLEGKPVRIKGFMNGAVFTRTNIRNFHLMREKECPFGPGGQAHHAIEVELQGKARTDFTTEELTVEGIFSVVPVKGENGNTWSLYRITGTSVK